VRYLDGDTPGWRRQAYLPFAGVYGVQVRDRRNTNRDADELPYGGEAFDYALRLEATPLVPTVLGFPVEESEESLEGANELPIFSLELEAGAVFEAEVWAERLAPSSGLDAMLYLVRQSDGAVLGHVDDTPIGTVDPLLRLGILGEDVLVYLIVDAYRIDHTSDYELSAALLEPSLDREPNDPVFLAYPAEPGVVIEGEVSAPYLRFRNTVTDSDFYVFPGGRSASYRVEVRPTGEGLEAAVRTGYRFISRGSSFFGEIFQADPPGQRGVVLEATSLLNEPFYVEVADRRNLFDPEAEPVGGAGFGYELEVTPFERTITNVALPVMEPESLSQPGEVDWFRFSVGGRVRLDVAALEQSEGPEPFVYLVQDNDAYIRRGDRGFSHLNNVPRTLRVAVADRRGGGGEGYEYDLTIDAFAFTPVAEVEPNDGPPVGGQVLGELPVWVDGELWGVDQSSFDTDVFVVSLEMGEVITIETAAGVNLELANADTIVTLSGPGMAQPLVDNNGGFGTASRIADFRAPASGAFEIAVTPWCDATRCVAGDYGLAIWSVAAAEE
jgi:hypothetical protein